MRKLISSNKKILIYYFFGKVVATTAYDNKNAFCKIRNKKVVLGSGSGSTISIYSKSYGINCDTPLYIILAHELVHAYRYSIGFGINYNSTCSTHKCRYDECYTVGLHTNHNAKYYSSYNENAIRVEHGLPKRLAC